MQRLFLAVGILLAMNLGGWTMNDDRIPSGPPSDAIARADAVSVLNWVRDMFTGTRASDGKSDVRLRVTRHEHSTLHFGMSCMETPITIGTRKFEHGLGTHANSEIVVTLPPGAKGFRAVAGIDNNGDTQGIRGSVQFIVEAAGRELIRTPTLKGGDEPFAVDADIPEEAREIVLKVDATEDGVGWDQSDWADAALLMSDGSVRYLDEGKSNLLPYTDGIPFSFTYGGASSRELLPRWRFSASEEQDKDRVRWALTWTDPDTGLVVTADLTAFKDYPAVEWLLHFENRGDKDTPVIEDIRTVDLELGTGKSRMPVVLHQLHGDSCSEMSFLPFDTRLDAGKSLTMAPARGRPSQQTAFPFWNLQFADRGMITAVGWSGQWSADFDRSQTGPTRFRAGMEKIHLVLHPGEKIRTPRVLMMLWTGDRQDAQNRFRRLMLFNYVPQRNGKPLGLPVCLQTFGRYRFRPGWATEEGQLHAAKSAHDLGCDAYWFDAAWFPGGFPNGVGNWYAKPDEFPRGLKPIGDLCREHSMEFVLWFEPCRVAPGTQTALDHPEWVLGAESRRLFNLGDPEARRWMTDLLSSRIGEYGVTVYREDYNIDPLGFWRDNDAPDRQGMNEIRFVEGHYAMWDELRARHPGLWIDNCASGGRRIDLETCMRAVPLWRSDTNCAPGHPEWNQMMSMALSQYVPLNTSAAWEPDPYTFRSSATAGTVCELAYLSPDFRTEDAKRCIAESKENRKYWYGNLYPLTPINTSLDQFTAFQLHRADLDAGIVVAFRRPECDLVGLIVGLRELNPDTVYRIESIDDKWAKSVKQARGSELQKSGLEIRIPEKAASLLIRYEPEDGRL